MVFQSNVYPECGSSAGGAFDNACNQRNLDADAKAPSKARIYTSLLYRHWTEWQTRRRQHLLVANSDGTEVRDLTPGKYDVPPFSLGGPDGYAISPDSLELAFVMNVDSEPVRQHQLRHLYRASRRRRSAQDHHQPRRATTALSIRPTESFWPSDRSSVPVMKAIAGVFWSWIAPPARPLISPRHWIAGSAASLGRPIPRASSSPPRTVAAPACK